MHIKILFYFDDDGTSYNCSQVDASSSLIWALLEWHHADTGLNCANTP
jgi:hypothetical protein